jgi:metallo-beta-lactamase class B
MIDHDRGPIQGYAFGNFSGRAVMYRAWILGVACFLPSIGRADAAPINCPPCEAWNKDQAPFQIFGNTYYVGTHGLSSILIASSAGHVLIDGALPQSAPLIARHVEQLGFRMRDVKVILNSHAHFDHAGGIAELQKMSGAQVIASDVAANVLRTGKVDRSDPQSRQLPAYPGSNNVEALGKRKSIDLGGLHLSVIHTPGHTPGGTSWSWKSCEDERCLSIVYGDSLTAVSDDSFKYGGDARYPNARADMFASISAIGAVPCDILVTPHPEVAGLWSVLDEHGEGNRAQLIDSSACKRYAAAAKARFDRRLESERR